MILLHSVDVYQQMHVLWTKYCTELDSLDPLQWNNTIFVELLWISALSGGFIGEFLQFCCLFSCWWSDKDTDYTCCVYSILKWFTSFGSQESQLFTDIWHAQLLVFLVFMSEDFTPSPLGGKLVSLKLKIAEAVNTVKRISYLQIHTHICTLLFFTSVFARKRYFSQRASEEKAGILAMNHLNTSDWSLHS